ncbi:hypothetical protein [Cupriavidus basilensis]|nr:hypothetical protein [Cupriavidus basilensis]MDF3889234.1 hypothetical protein [Cupriavidus basilensis]
MNKKAPSGAFLFWSRIGMKAIEPRATEFAAIAAANDDWRG